MRQEAAKPFARSADDADIDRAFRDRVRFGDPMAHLAARRAGNAPPPPVVPQHMQRQMRKSGFVVPQVRLKDPTFFEFMRQSQSGTAEVDKSLRSAA